MSTGPRYFIPFRRRREGRTDYYARGKLLLSEHPRMIVRRTNREIIIQLAVPEQDGDKTLVAAYSRDLKAYGYTGGSCEWGNYRDECVCSGVVYTTWTPTGACNYNGDAYCWDRETMYYCTANTIYSYDCTTFCYDYYQSYPLDAFCMYNATRQCPGGGGNCPDDNCYCVY